MRLSTPAPSARSKCSTPTPTNGSSCGKVKRTRWVEELAVFSPELTAVDFVTDQVRLTIDEAAVEGWNEIDAVKLIGVTE